MGLNLEHGAGDEKGGARYLSNTYQLLVLPAGWSWCPCGLFD